jgi:transposase
MIDRDLNAARNLARLAEAEAGLVAVSSAETRNACGEGSAGRAATGPVELPSVKQERTRVHTLTEV